MAHVDYWLCDLCDFKQENRPFAVTIRVDGTMHDDGTKYLDLCETCQALIIHRLGDAFGKLTKDR